MSGDMRFAMSPATPLSLTSLCQIASSSGGCTEYSSPAPHLQVFRSCLEFLSKHCVIAASKNLSGAGSPAGAILLWDLRPRICSCACLPAGLRLGAGPFASRHSQRHFFNTALRRGRDLAKRNEAQGVAGTHDTQCCVPT